MQTLIHVFVLDKNALLAMDDNGNAFLSKPSEFGEIETKEHGQWSDNLVSGSAPATFNRHSVFDSSSTSSPFYGLSERLLNLEVGVSIEFSSKSLKYAGIQPVELEGLDFFSDSTHLKMSSSFNQK